MPVTAKDIAKELNLSQPTVSRILNGDEGHRAAEETRQRVLEAARRLGYQPNAVARSLRRGRTHTIGVHTYHQYDVRNDFLGTIVGALQCACGPHHLDVMLHSAVHGSPPEAILSQLRDGRVDGLILHSSAEDPLVKILSQSSLPVVAVADPLPGLPAVTSDDAHGMQQLVQLLWARGHRNFVFLAPEVRLPSVERRASAFESVLADKGVVETSRKVRRIDFENADLILDELLADSPLAVCCWNDRTAYILLRECLKRGIRVPEQLAVAGFDGFRDDKLPARQLVTVQCPWEDVATRALEILVGLIKERSGAGPSFLNNDRALEVALPTRLLDGDTA